jgi:hypothetical protein
MAETELFIALIKISIAVYVNTLALGLQLMLNQGILKGEVSLYH